MIGPLGHLAPLGGRRYRRIANVVLLGEVPSTNEVARALAERMLAEDSDLDVTAVVARRQTAGKGRTGRSWSSFGERGLALSLVLPWPEGPERVRVPIVSGIRVARALSAGFSLPVRLKWPNDLLVGGRKLGGILTEGCTGSEEAGYAVVGIGLNGAIPRAELDAAGLQGATSLLAELGPRADLEPEPLLHTVLELLDGALGDEVDDIPAAFAEVAAHGPGDPLEVHDGDRVVSGSYAGVTDDGFLVLKRPDGEVTVLSGDVHPG